MEWTLEFDETGGYDCMSGAYFIKFGEQTVCTVDLKDYDQHRCDYKFHSPEAQANAEFIFESFKNRTTKE